MLRNASRISLFAAGIALSGAVLAAPTTLTPIAVGINPKQVAVNPATNKVYVTNFDDNTVTVVDGYTRATKAVAVGVHPQEMGINPETNAVFVGNTGDGTYSVIDAQSDAVRSTGIIQASGVMGFNPFTNRLYMARNTTGDEVNLIIGDNFLYAAAVRGHVPLSLVFNPVTNRMYQTYDSGGDVVAFNMDGDPEWPPRECPDGNGGLLVDTDTHNPTPPPCIQTPDTGVSLAINPVTARIYVVSARGAISEIQGPNNTFVSFMPPSGAPAGAHSIAVNPITNKVYATYADRIVVMDGNTHAMQEIFTTTVATGNNLGIAVDVLANRVHVLNSAGVLLTVDGDTNALSALAGIPAPKWIAVNPLTHVVYVVGDQLYAAADTGVTAHASPISVAITPIAGNSTTNGTGSLTVNASSAMSPAPLDQVRDVYYEIVSGNGAFTGRLAARASGSGPWTIPYSNLAPGTYTVNVIATNGLDAPSTNTGEVSVLVTSAVARYTFTVGTPPPDPLPAPGTIVRAAARVDFNADFRADLAWRHGSDNQHAAWVMSGTRIVDGRIVTGPTADARIVAQADFAGDGKTDLLWKAGNGDVFMMPMEGVVAGAASLVRAGSEGWAFVASADFDGDGRADLLWFNATSGYQVWLMNGGSVATQGALAIPAAAAKGVPVAIADLDGDGRSDILWAGPDGTMVACLMAGTTCASTPTVRAAGSGFTPTAIGDFNGDGKADIVWTHTDGRVSLWLMNGGTTIDSAQLLGPGTGWRVAFAADLDGDTRSDLIWANSDGSSAGWLMAGVAAKAYGSFLGANTGWSIVGTADLDGDGKADLLWRYVDGNYGPWIMNGLQATAYATFFGPNTGWEIVQ